MLSPPGQQQLLRSMILSSALISYDDLWPLLRDFHTSNHLLGFRKITHTHTHILDFKPPCLIKMWLLISFVIIRCVHLCIHTHTHTYTHTHAQLFGAQPPGRWPMVPPSVTGWLLLRETKGKARCTILHCDRLHTNTHTDTHIQLSNLRGTWALVLAFNSIVQS